MKKTYRNVIQIQSGGECDDDALFLLQNSLMDDSMEIDIMDGPKDMMRSVFIYHPSELWFAWFGHHITCHITHFENL